MNAVLVDGLSYAGHYFPAGTIVALKGEPASGGYFYAMAELDGRAYLISIRQCDTTTVETETEVLDRDDNPITLNARVEYRTFNPAGSECDGLTGRVDDIGSDGMIGVEWDTDLSEVQWHCPSVLLVVS